MSYTPLPYSKAYVLKQVQNLPYCALLYDQLNAKIVVCFAPRQRRICRNLNELNEFLASISATSHTLQPAASWGSFGSGWLGYFQYQAGRLQHQADQHLPQSILAEFNEYECAIHLNLTDEQAYLANPRSLTSSQLQPYFDLLEQANASVAAEASSHAWQSAWDFTKYQSAFQQVKNYLLAGDCYQVNLAMPFYCNDDLRLHNPMPLLSAFAPSFGGYFKGQERTLFSVSPERFINIHGTRIETRPIKGTVARGQTPEEDLANKTWLAQSSKNQAENLMIVDLLRNDLSHYAAPHTVKVETLFGIETHANVHHMVSTISAEKAPEVTNAEVIWRAFPGGSITGAPKKRAIEIIHQLEAEPRQAYCGSMGFFDDSGYTDFNILIRTIEATAQGAVCWGGGGIVMDSNAEEEWQELHTKVRRILDTPL